MDLEVEELVLLVKMLGTRNYPDLFEKMRVLGVLEGNFGNTYSGFTGFIFDKLMVVPFPDGWGVCKKGTRIISRHPYAGGS